MQRVHLLSGVSWAVLFEQKDRWLEKAGAELGAGGSENGPAGGVLVIIPTDWKLSAKSELLKHHLAGCQVLTTEELVEGYLRQAAGKQPEGLNRAASPPGAKQTFKPGILLDKHQAGYLLDSILKDSALDALQEMAPAGSRHPQSGYLNIETFRQGYLRALCEYIFDFRQTHHEDLLPVLESLKKGKLSAKEKDLVDIHAEFERLLEQRGLFDYRRGVAAFLRDRDRDQGRQRTFMPETSLVIAGFSRLTDLDRRLLLGLVERFQQSVILCCSNPQAAEAVFRVQAAFEAFLQGLRDSPAELREDKIEEAGRNRSCAFLPLAELMFHDDKKNRLFPASRAVELVQAEDRYSEVISIARHILELRRQGVEYHQIRLVFSDYELYMALLLEVFPRYGIPYRPLKGTPLKFYPLAGIVQSLVAHGVSPNPYPLREKIFSSPYVSFSCLIKPEELVRFARDKDIPIAEQTIQTASPEPRRVELDHRWCLEQQRRAARVVKSEAKLEPLRLAARFLEERFAGDADAREREMLRLLINFYVLSQAEKSLYPWRSKMTPSAFCRCVQKLIERFQVAENIHSQEGSLKDEIFASVAAQDQRVLETLELLLERLQTHFNQLSGEEYGQNFGEDLGEQREGERQYPLLSLAGAFGALMSDPELTLPSSEVEGVPVFASSDVPVSFYPVTFVGGLVDGAFPAKEPFNFLAPRKEGPGGGSGESLLIDRERQNLYQIIAGTTERLYLYFPFSDGGKKLLTSPFVAEIERCLASPVAGRSAEKASVKEAGLCFNTREKLIFAGGNLDRAYARTLPVLQELKSASGERFRHIAVILRCDGLRGSPEALSCFDGIFGSSTEPASAAAWSIRRQMDGAALMEVEQLERYAGCPLRFLFDDLMGLKPDYQVDYHPDTTDRGLLVKKILCGYSAAAAAAAAGAGATATAAASASTAASALAPAAASTPAAVAAQAPADALPGGRKTPENPEQLLRALAEEAFASMPLRENDLFSGSYRRSILRGLVEAASGEHVPHVPHGEQAAHAGRGEANQASGTGGAGGTGGTAGDERRPGLLSAFLDYERQAPDLISPCLAGLELSDFQAAGIPVRIAIERADITSNGRFLIIYTYSISDPGNVGGINKGLRFQAPLMILALRSYLGEKGLDKQVGGAGVYLVKNPRMVKRGGYFALQQLQATRRTQVSPEQPLFSGQRQYGFLPLKRFEQELEETERRVGRIDELIRKGRFNPTLCAVKDQTCGNCSFTRICRKDQLRLDKIYTAIGEEELYKPRRKIELAEPESEPEE